MITVMGASGHTGKRVAEHLLEAGRKVRVIGRSKDKLLDLEKKGAEVMIGDAGDASFLTRAFRDADGVYTLLPPDTQSEDFAKKQDRTGEAIVAALRENRVARVVFLSSVGADRPDGTGPIAGLHRQEQRLRKLENTDVLLLRPGSFFENMYGTLGLIKHQGINGGSIVGDRPIPMIATRDIADAAAKALESKDWTGVVVRELLGPRDISYAEATRILGAKIGKPDLAYVQLPYEDFAKGLTQAGFHPKMAALYAEMTRGFNEGKIKPIEGRNPKTTTPTRFEDFAEELARAYQAM